MAVTKRIRKSNGKKTTVYQAEVWVNAVRVENQYFETAAQAHLWHDDIKRKYTSGPSHVVAGRRITFGEALARYRSDEAFTTLRRSTQQARGVRLRYLEQGPLVNVKMDDFGAHHVDEWLLWLKQLPTATSYRRKSFRHELQILSIVLNWYRNEVNPSFVPPVVKRHRKKSVHKPTAPRRPDYFMRREDIARWLDALKAQSIPVYYRLATFMVLTGTRLGEAAGLHWDAVNLGDRVAWVMRTLAWDHHSRAPYIQDEAKNDESIRSLGLAPLVVDLLGEMRRTARSGIVFTNAEGGYLRDNAIRSAFNRAFRTCGLPWTATRITRHTWATWGLVATNSNISAVQVNMGHGQRATTEIYAKPVAGLTSEVIDKTAALMLPAHHVRNHVTPTTGNEEALH